MLIFVRISLAIALLGAFTLEASAGASPAASPSPVAPLVPKFSIQPVGDFSAGYIDEQVSPGESVSLTASVRTTPDSATAKLRVFRTNSLAITNGGFGAGTEVDPPTSATSWVKFPATSFTLDANQHREFPFTINVPKDAKPGQYVIAIVVQTDGPVVIPGMTTFNQVIRSSMAIMITVPGALHAGFTLGAPAFNSESPAPSLVIPVTNTGNILVKPAGDLTISTTDGTVVTKAPVAMGSVYGGYSTTIQISLPEQMKPGDYVVSAALTDAATKASATIEKQTITLADRNAPPPQFSVDPATVAANATPIQFAKISVTVNNAGQGIPTAKVVLRVTKNGQPLEDYTLAQGQALPNGATTVAQRYIPANGWQPGTYAFSIVVSSVDSATGTETILSTTPVSGTIVVP
jgi:hypothetical protein